MFSTWNPMVLDLWNDLLYGAHDFIDVASSADFVPWQ
jgi:hypothetical protein